MSILSQEFIFSAIDAEKAGETFPIPFDDVWETFGYSRKANARRYLINRSGLKSFTSRQLLRLEISYRTEDKDKIYLSIDSYKFALARANTPEGEEYLLYLIEVEKQYRLQLEQTFQSQVNDASESAKSDRDLLNDALNDAESEILVLQQKLEQSLSNHQVFSFSAKFLHNTSGIVSFPQVKGAIKRDFVEGRDWILVGKDIYLNEPTFNILVVSFRSVRGVNLAELPEVIKLETKLYFQYQEMRRKNRRVAQCDGQLTLDLGDI